MFYERGNQGAGNVTGNLVESYNYYGGGLTASYQLMKKLILGLTYRLTLRSSNIPDGEYSARHCGTAPYLPTVMNIDPNILEIRRPFLMRRQRMIEIGGYTWLQHCAVVLALLALYGWFPGSAQAEDKSSSSVQSNAPTAVASGAAQSNAFARSSQTTTTTDNPKASTDAEAGGVSKSGSANGMDALDDRHKLNIGDRLSFRIVEDGDDPKQIAVTDSGDLELPYIGRYPAVGKTCRELAWKLKAELEKDYYYHATVIIAVNEWAKGEP